MTDTFNEHPTCSSAPDKQPQELLRCLLILAALRVTPNDPEILARRTIVAHPMLGVLDAAIVPIAQDSGEAREFSTALRDASAHGRNVVWQTSPNQFVGGPATSTAGWQQPRAPVPPTGQSGDEPDRADTAYHCPNPCDSPKTLKRALAQQMNP